MMEFADFEKSAKREKIFLTLRKLDAIWANNVNFTFCDLYKFVIGQENLSDEELSIKLTKFIEENNIKL